MKKSILRIMFMIFVGSTSFTSVVAQELVYVPVNPCRIVDTRNAGGVIAANTFRNFRVSGTVGQLAVQGGTANCLDPKAGTGLSPLAISAYVVAVPPPGSGPGVLTAYPSNQPPPPTGSGSTVNFAAGQVIGNTTNITLCDPSGFCPANGEFSILARSTNQHVVIDVQGYFYPQSGSGDIVTVVVETQSDGNVSSAVTSEVILTTCPTGTLMTGGGVTCGSNNFNSSTTNFGVIFTSTPVGNSYGGHCGSDALFHSSSKFGPPITVFAVCASSANVATSQATTQGIAAMQAISTDTDANSQSQQGEPSQEALLLLESLRDKAAEMERMSNER